MIGTPAPDQHVPAGHQRADGEGTGHDPVRDRAVRGGPQFVDAVDHQRGGARAVKLRAHRRQHRAEVGDLGLAGGIVDHGRTLGEHTSHHQVLGGAHAREVQPDGRSLQAAGRPGHKDARLDIHHGSELGQTADMHVQSAAADRVPAGQGHPSFAAAGDQRAQHDDGRPDPADHIAVGRRTGPYRHVDRQRAAREIPLDGHSERSQHIGHDRDIKNVGHSTKSRPTMGQQARGHQLEHGVLRPRDIDLADKPRPAPDHEAFHGTRCYGLGTRPSAWAGRCVESGRARWGERGIV